MKDMTKYRNQYNKDHYERVSLVLPKGTKDKIKETGNTVHGFIVAAVMKALKENSL